VRKRQRVERARKAVAARWAKARAAKTAAAVAVPKTPVGQRIHDAALELSRNRPGAGNRENIFGPAQFPPQAMPPKDSRMAQDSAQLPTWAWNALSSSGFFAEGQTFLGFPYLAELAQRPEYRRMVEQLAFHMTRRWIKIKSAGGEDKGKAPEQEPKPGVPPPDAAAKLNGGAQDEFPPPKPAAKPNGNGAAPPEAEVKLSAAGTPLVDPLTTQADAEVDAKAEKIKELEDEFERLKVRQHFKEIVEHDGFFGRGHIYIDLGSTEDPDELATSITLPDGSVSPVKVQKGSLKGLKTVEPIWAYPMTYDAIDPLKPGWYRPDHWYVMRRQVHRSRLLTFVSREVPDMLKPAYAFGGVPLTQMAKPYVDNWIRTRQSVSDLINSFSQFVLSTDLLPQLASAEGTSQLFKRLDTFNNTRSNRGVMAVDKEREELDNVSAPLGSLDALQTQAQEQMAFVSAIPIMFLLGDSPTGLNASSEGVIRAFYDWVHANQEFQLQPKLDVIFELAQINLWGEIDEDLTYEFVPLWQATEKEKSEMLKGEADRDSVYLSDGVLHADEIRSKLANDPDSGYDLDLSREIPEPPAPELPPGFGGEPGATGEEQPGKPVVQ
jgi:phage-related protein (TIGR01555 family)